MLRSNIQYIKNELQFLLDSTPAAMFIEDENGKIMRVNRALIDLLKYTSYREAVGKRFEDLVEIELTDMPDLSKNICTIAFPEESKRQYEVLKIPCEGRSVVVLTDVNDYVLLSEELKRSNSRLQDLLENLEEAFGVIYPDNPTRFYYHNKRWKQIMDKSNLDQLLCVFSKYLEHVKSLGTPIELKDCEIIKGEFFNFLFYKFNGGVAILGRKIHDAPSQTSIRLSYANSLTDLALQRILHAK